MAETNDKKDPEMVPLKPGQVVVDQKMLSDIIEKQALMEKQIEDSNAKTAGMEAILLESQSADTTGEKKLRERKNFEPTFRTVTLKKRPMFGDLENEGYVIGWSNRGAYQKVNRDGVAPVTVDYLDVFYLGNEKDKKGVLQAESVPLLELMGAREVHCKVLEMRDYKGREFIPTYPPTGQAERKVPTGEAIRVTTWDPKHGLIETGEEIDGWVAFTDVRCILQVPGVSEPVEVDSKYLNI